MVDLSLPTKDNMILTQKNQDFIKAHALETDNEVCGLIIEKDGEYIPIRCKNVSYNPSEHFIVDPFDYLMAAQQGTIVAVYHSHNDNKLNFNFLSMFDIDQSKFNQLIYILYYIPKGTFNIIDPKEASCKYLGRKFVLGKMDCWTLAQDFYRDEFQIILGDYERSSGWKKQNPNIMENSFLAEGFVEVKDLKFGDLLLFSRSISKPAEHIGIYIGSNLFLHQSDKEDSNISLYNHFYQSTTKYKLRHKKNL